MSISLSPVIIRGSGFNGWFTLDYSTSNGHRPIIPGTVIKNRRASLTKSKLRAPDSPVYALASQFQNYIHLPDPMPLYALMSAVAGNMLKGYSLWMMLVGASGSGKTMLLKSLGRLPATRRVSSIKSEAALLSGVKKKDRAVGATGGLLREMQWGTEKGFGGLVFLDFTSVLSMQRDSLKTMLGAFREIYDGNWSREIGGEGGMVLTWEGKIAMLAGVTHAIDRHYEIASEMGERFLYYRFPPTDGYQESIGAADVVDPERNEKALADLVAGMFAAIGLSFENEKPRRALRPSEKDRIVGLAQFGAKARSPVVRDHFSKTKEITDVLTPEVSTRMTVEMAQLYLGGEEIGLDDEDRWRVLEKVAMDSMPLTRGTVLQAVLRAREKGNGWPTGEIVRVVKCGDTSIRRELENLEMLGVVKKNAAGGWEGTEWTKERVGAGR